MHDNSVIILKLEAHIRMYCIVHVSLLRAKYLTEYWHLMAAAAAADNKVPYTSAEVACTGKKNFFFNLKKRTQELLIVNTNFICFTSTN